MKVFFIFLINIFFISSKLWAADLEGQHSIHLRIGFVQKVPCKGRLYLSAVGNESLVRLEALPKEVGCGVVLKPMGRIGETNLILETSSGTVVERLTIGTN